MQKEKNIYMRGTTFVGYVVKEQNKTVIVEIKNKIKHRRYKKVIIKTSKYIVHDQENQCCIGDVVLFSHSRPYSRKKRWVINKIIRKNYFV